MLNLFTEVLSKFFGLSFCEDSHEEFIFKIANAMACV